MCKDQVGDIVTIEVGGNDCEWAEVRRIFCVGLKCSVTVSNKD